MLCRGLPPPGDARRRVLRQLRRAARRASRRRSSSCSPAASGCRSSSDVVIGRSPGSTLQLDDPSVSRTHARISAANGDGADRGRGLEPRHVRRRRAADRAARAARRAADPDRRPGAGGRAAARAAPRPGARSSCARARRSWSARSARAGVAAQATQFGMHPRMRSGYALKRLDADEGARRWVLRDLSRDGFLRLSDNDAAAVRAARRHAARWST